MKWYNVIMHNRFLFDADFSIGTQAGSEHDRRSAKPGNNLDETEYQKGFHDGLAAAKEAHHAAIVALLEQISASLAKIHLDGQSSLTEIEFHLVSIVVDLARHFATDLDPVTILTKPQFGVADVLEKVGRNSQLTLSLSSEDAIHLRDHFVAASIESAAIHEDTTLASGQFELRWSDGGMIFDPHRLDHAYQEFLEYYHKGVAGDAQ